MKAAVMQPYFFPYIGYWQLISAVDCFVIFDDVNFINKSWIYRNRILSEKNPFIKLPLLGASQNKKINEISVNQLVLQKKINSKILHESYRKAPNYVDTMTIIEECMYGSQENLADYLKNQIAALCEKLRIRTKIVLSSNIEKPENIKGINKIIWICNEIGADEYINPIGGYRLYDPMKFMVEGIKLSFIRPNLLPYQQFEGEFVPALSIIDVLMFCGIEDICGQLDDYTIMHKDEELFN